MLTQMGRISISKVVRFQSRKRGVEKTHTYKVYVCVFGIQSSDSMCMCYSLFLLVLVSGVGEQDGCRGGSEQAGWVGSCGSG